MISLSKYMKLITLVWLINFLSIAHSRRSGNTTGLNCTLTIAEKDVNGIYHNDKRQILMVNRCPADYKNEDIIKKCEELISSDNPLDTDLFAPGINSPANVTYWNKFCATCNNDSEIDWPPWGPRWSGPTSKLVESLCENYSSEIQNTDVDGLDKLTRTFISKGMKLEATNRVGKEMECSMEENWPISLIFEVALCLIGNFEVGQHVRLTPCQYVEKNGRICTKMLLFIEGLEFSFSKNNKPITYDKWSKLNFTQGEYIVEGGYDNVFYYCEQHETIYITGNWVKISISIISIIFSSVYLVMNFNKQWFQNFSNKMLFSYLLGLIVMYIILTFIYLSFPVPCVAFYLAQFSWFFHFFWTMLTFIEFIEFRFLAYGLFVENDRTESAQHKRWIIYCILGFVVPTIMPIIYYFCVLQVNENHCPVIRDHFVVSCVSTYPYSKATSSMNILLVILNLSFSLFIPMLFLLVLAGVLVYFKRECGGGSRWTTNRNLPIFLMKLSFIVAFHWTLYKLQFAYRRDDLSTTASPQMDSICQLSIDLQGVLVVFVFWVKKSMLINILEKCGFKIKTTGENGMELNEQSHPLSPQDS